MISGVPYCACRSPYTGAYCQNGPSSTSTNTNPTTYVSYIVVFAFAIDYIRNSKTYSIHSLFFLLFFIELLLIIFLSNGFNNLI